jgi:hypothetical protein
VVNLPPLTIGVTAEDATCADSQLEGRTVGRGEVSALAADRDETVGCLDDAVVPEFNLDTVGSSEQPLVHRPDRGPAAADSAERIVHHRNLTRFPVSRGELEIAAVEGAVELRQDLNRPRAIARILAAGDWGGFGQHATSTYTVIAVTVVTMSFIAPGEPESIRENVWPGRTELTTHWSSGAVPTLLTITSNPRACSWPTAWDASVAPEGAAPATPANPKVAAPVAPAAITSEVKDFIVLPFEEGFLTAVWRCPSFVTAAGSDGSFVADRRCGQRCRCLDSSRVGALTDFGESAFPLPLPSRQCAVGAPCLGDSVLRYQQQYGAHLFVTGSRRPRQIDMQREGFVERLVQHVGRDARQRPLAR